MGIVIQPGDDEIGDTSDLLGGGVAICSRLGRFVLRKNRSGVADRAHAKVAGAVGGDAGIATCVGVLVRLCVVDGVMRRDLREHIGSEAFQFNAGDAAIPIFLRTGRSWDGVLMHTDTPINWARRSNRVVRRDSLARTALGASGRCGCGHRVGVRIVAIVAGVIRIFMPIALAHSHRQHVTREGNNDHTIAGGGLGPLVPLHFWCIRLAQRGKGVAAAEELVEAAVVVRNVGVRVHVEAAPTAARRAPRCYTAVAARSTRDVRGAGLGGGRRNRRRHLDG